MNIIRTEIDGVFVLEPEVFKDGRGYFFESYSQKDFDTQIMGIRFVQDNESKSRYGVVRGLHFQYPPYSQSKLVRVVRGAVLDVAVDIRRGSPTFGRHVSVDAPFVDGEDNSLLDVLVNNDSPNADKGLVNESLNKEIERALSTLTERERDIVKDFFGIGTQEMTLEEIGEKFGLTRERVRQIKEKAIRRLRHSNRSKLLKSYLG